MIQLERASRWYGQVIGLNDVSCRIGPGLTALLGPNGAGKSTLFKLITGQMRPTTGRVLVHGVPPFANPAVMRRLGYCPEIDNFYEDMTGREFVTMLAAMSGWGGPTLRAKADAAIDRVGMSDRCDRKLGGYSKGMRQRIKVAQAIVHDPDVFVLDEPLNGLDPVGRRELADLMLDFARQGKCVIVSSHILYEVEQITDNILLIDRGRLLAQGGIHAIRERMDQLAGTFHPHRIVLTVGEGRTRELAGQFLSMPFVLGVRLDPGRPDHVEVETNKPNLLYDQLPDLVLSGNFAISSFHSPDNNLEAIFRDLMSAA